MTKDADQEEEYRLSFRVYSNNLRALASDPAAACDQMGNYNSAGEIWYELTAGACVSSSPFIALTEDQRMAIDALARKLKELPGDAMAPAGVMPTSHAACLVAMRHPAWIPLRQQASKLLENLAPAIQRNQDFLNAL